MPRGTAGSIRAFPPASAARAAIPPSPCRPSANACAARAGSIPRPSSTTSARTSEPSRAIATRALLAPECFARLWIASFSVR